MSSFTATFFLTAQTHVRGNALPGPALYVEPDGWHGPGYVVFQMPNQMPREDCVRIAEAFLAGVTAWRDEIVQQAERERTAAEELAEARAEIARLKGETAEGGGAQ